jgi:DNA polymerase III epsilon subunit-like protein
MPRPLMKDCNLFFFDSETGGLDHVKHDMVEMACIVTDPTGERVLHEYCAKVHPLKPVDPQAAAINGYSKEKWAAEAADIDTVMVKMLGLARDSVFVAHNTPFDWGFFSMALATRGARWPGDYHKIDTCALAAPFLKAGLVENVKLMTVASYFGVPHENAHSALGDVRACRGIYLAMMKRFAGALANGA